VLLLFMALPLLGIARFRNIYPTRLLLALAAIPAALSLLMLLQPVIGWIVLAIDVFLVAVALLDLLTVISQRHFSANRNCVKVASLTKPQDVELELTNHSTRRCTFDIKDDLPQSFAASPSHFPVQIEGHSRTAFLYQYTPAERGQHLLECVHLCIASWLKLWQGYYRIPCLSTIHVYPDLKQIAEYDLLAKTNRLSLLGMRRTRKIGQDNEFERLRDYTTDDSYKHIDWRTTARRRKLTVRDFQANQSQRIIFMVDCGRMMTGMSNELSFLDHSLNAMLMLSYVALKQGDSVGLITFSNQIHNFTPARPGTQHINRLLHASFDQRASHVESRYDEAFLYLRKHCRKRSLVVLLTNVIDEINSQQIRQYLGTLTSHHLPLGVLLRDDDLFSVVDNIDYSNRETVFQAAAAAEVLTWRHSVISDLQHSGVLALDVFPSQLTSTLVNQYLEIKARHLL